MSLRLVRLTLREIRLPLVEPFRTTDGVVDVRRIVLAELTDGDGHMVWSECVAEALPRYSPDTVDSCWLALTEWIAPVVLGASFDAPDGVHTALARQVRGHNMARAVVEMGAWALDALRQDLPLATLLARAVGGGGGAMPRPFVETGIALGMQATPDALADRARAALQEGYARVKIKIEPGRDVAWVRAVRLAIGEGRHATLSVDANCSYTLDDPSHAAALAALDDMGLAMIEQPLAHDDLVHHAELQRRLRTPLCLDESIRDAASTETMRALGSARIVNLKPGRVGGFGQALAIHEICRSAGVPVWCGGMLECGIGRAYNVALASLPNFTLPGDLSPSSRYWARDVVTPAWTMDARGRVQVPLDRPGLGVDVDTALIDELTVRTITLRAR
jgi:O-succinylbenzoate synthase